MWNVTLAGLIDNIGSNYKGRAALCSNCNVRLLNIIQFNFNVNFKLSALLL